MCLQLQQPHEWEDQIEFSLGYPDQVFCLGDDDTLGVLAFCLAVMSQC